MAANGPLFPRTAARLLFAAGILDLLFVYVLAGMAYPGLKDNYLAVLPAELQDFAFPLFFIILLPLLWFATDVILGGYSPGRIALGLSMSDAEGGHLSLSRRFARFVGKLLCFGLGGLRLDGLSRYDRMAKTVWRCPLAPPADADFRLVFLSGQYKGRTGKLDKLPKYRRNEPIRIGRSSDWSQIPFADPRISARHCELAITNGLPMIRDLGSSHGTLVNGRRIRANTWVSLAGAREFAIAEERMTLRVV